LLISPSRRSIFSRPINFLARNSIIYENILDSIHIKLYLSVREKKDYQVGVKVIVTASVVYVIGKPQERELLELDHLIVKAAHFLRKAYQLRVHPSEAP
jgi:hypothetical protein